MLSGLKMKMATYLRRDSKSTKLTHPTSWPSSKAINVSRSSKPSIYATPSQWSTLERLSVDGTYETEEQAMAEKSMNEDGKYQDEPDPRRWTYSHPNGGRTDVDGTIWFACDPYPTWYRWEEGELYTKAKPKWPK